MKTLIAHRGMSVLAPENTLSSFRLCKEYGIRWLECDVDILADHTIVVSHDDSLDRCTDKSGSLYDLKYHDLSEIDAGSWFSDDFIGERIPTVNQLILLANELELNLNIEIKSNCHNSELSNYLIDKLIQSLRKLDSNRQLIVSSFNHMILSKLKEKRPITQVACLFETHTLLDDWKLIVESCQADYIHPQNEGLTQQHVQDFKAFGLKVNVWTVNDLARANQLFNWGVDGICSDIAHKFPSKYKFISNICT